MQSDELAEDEEEGEEVAPNCIASKKNSWDFLCEEQLPPDIAAEFGYESGDPQALAKFDRRKTQGDVTVCGSGMSVKGQVFHGKFGDGLTGEYFPYRFHRSCGPPFLFGKIPKLVRVDTTIDYKGDFKAAYLEYTIRWSGKILVEQSGEYEFGLESDDGSWLAIADKLVVNNGGCHNKAKKTGVVKLEKGGHKIAVIYFSRGPPGTKANPTGGAMCQMTYKGPDSGKKWAVVPQAKLGSNPLRLSKLSDKEDKEVSIANPTDEADEAEVQPGSFIWDEQHQLAIMPEGSCDLNCRRGKGKTTAAPFRFVCSKPADVAFKATVSKDAARAFIRLNDKPSTLWELDETKRSSLLFDEASELNSTGIPLDLIEQDMAKATETDAGDSHVALLQALGSGMNVKGQVFHGKFGDGLTGEYIPYDFNHYIFREHTTHRWEKVWNARCDPPFLFGKIPKLVRVDTTIDYKGDFKARFNEYVIRWSGKILVEQSGEYEFGLESDDGSWLAIEDKLVVDNAHCFNKAKKTGVVKLEKGSHKIAVLYFNSGPPGTKENPTGGAMCQMTYKGPDSGKEWVVVPQAKLQPKVGSNLLSLSKLSDKQDKEVSIANDLQEISLKEISLKESATSPAFAVGAGEYTLRFQGRPSTDQAFALRDLSFAKGGQECKFFLEGKDKEEEDCH